MDAVGRGIERALEPLDWLRRELIRGLGPISRLFIVDREARVAAVGISTVLVSFLCALAFPIWTLALGPILLGVPHLVADARYMVMRPALYRRPEVALGIGLPLLATAIWPHAWMGMLTAVGAVACARASWSRRAIGLVAASGLYVVCKRYVYLSDLASVHLHNLVAILLWWFWRQRSGPLHWSIPATFALATAAIFGGLAGPVLAFTGGLAGPATATTAQTWMHTIAPRLPQDLAVAVVISYAFAQSVHYGLWLRLMPEEDRVRDTPRSFLASYRALEADLGGWQLAAFAAFTLAIAIWGALDLAAARTGYLRLSIFHVYLEVGVAALLWAEGSRSVAPPATQTVGATI